MCLLLPNIPKRKVNWIVRTSAYKLCSVNKLKQTQYEL
uniref:Uncharacterized protein n=1 Tax=Rhizophora mucronata TaxID=61149 RepID=A0A2P2PDQ5_RHIMU